MEYIFIINIFGDINMIIFSINLVNFMKIELVQTQNNILLEQRRQDLKHIVSSSSPVHTSSMFILVYHFIKASSSYQFILTAADCTQQHQFTLARKELTLEKNVQRPGLMVTEYHDQHYRYHDLRHDHNNSWLSGTTACETGNMFLILIFCFSRQL